MLLDTSGMLCLHHRAEPLHEVACHAYRNRAAFLTHGHVLAEFVALAQTRRLPRLPALSFISDLLANPDITTVWVDRGLHDAAMTLLMNRSDKAYSLCDAVSFVLMRKFGIDDALTTDRHFVQEGFRRLLEVT